MKSFSTNLFDFLTQFLLRRNLHFPHPKLKWTIALALTLSKENSVFNKKKTSTNYPPATLIIPHRLRTTGLVRAVSLLLTDVPLLFATLLLFAAQFTKSVREQQRIEIVFFYLFQKQEKHVWTRPVRRLQSSLGQRGSVEKASDRDWQPRLRPSLVPRKGKHLCVLADTASLAIVAKCFVGRFLAFMTFPLPRFLVCSKASPATCTQVLRFGGRYIFGGNIFVFIISFYKFKRNFSAHNKIWRALPPNAPP